MHIQYLRSSNAYQFYYLFHCALLKTLPCPLSLARAELSKTLVCRIERQKNRYKETDLQIYQIERRFPEYLNCY